MAGYEELKYEDEEYNFNDGPRVVRDCMMVKEIAENTERFVGSGARPRYTAQRYAHFHPDEE